MKSKMALLCLGLSMAALGQTVPVPGFSFQSQQSARDDADYKRGLSALDARDWDQAIAAFDASAAGPGANKDAALYWKAYAQNRAGRGQAALSTISQLRERYPSSRWIKDARALELEVKTQSGQAVSMNNQPDDDLKLMALNALMQSNPAAAMPVVNRVLASNNPDRVKEQALFVLAQSGSPDAYKILGNMANGNGSPALRIKAIHLMGMMGNDDARKALAALYSSSSDSQVKRAILQGFMQSGSRDFLLNAAKSEKDPQLRTEAIRQMALAGGKDQLWQLYQTGSAGDKKTILQSMFLSGDSSRLLEVARSEKDPELRAAAIHSLGLMGNGGAGDALASIYESDSDAQVRRAVIEALFLQQNGKPLIALAKREKDPQMKKQIISKLALIHSQDVTDYMMELLK